MKTKIGFIGLGIMGKPMSRNLIKAGHQIVVYDISPESVAALAASGASAGKSAKDVAARSDITITMVPDGPEVEAARMPTRQALPGGLTTPNNRPTSWKTGMSAE